MEHVDPPSPLLDEPAPGIGLIGAGGPGDEVYTFVRAHLFGDARPRSPRATSRPGRPGWDSS